MTSQSPPAMPHISPDLESVLRWAAHTLPSRLRPHVTNATVPLAEVAAALRDARHYLDAPYCREEARVIDAWLALYEGQQAPAPEPVLSNSGEFIGWSEAGGI